MIYILILLIPTLVLLVSFLLFKHKLTHEEMLVQAIAPVLLSFLLYICASISLTLDSESYGEYITSCKHEEPWNEYVHRICMRTVGSGKTQRTETYDCSYVQYHSEKWTAYTNCDSNVYINEEHYNKLKSIFKNEKKTGHNSGYTISGDIFQIKYNGVYNDLQPYTSVHRYKNKVQASKSVFKFQEISKEEADALGLYHENLVSGFGNYSSYGVVIPSLERLNAYYGSTYEVRVLILVYNKPMPIFEKQRSYWNGGNKNELVIGIGLNEGKVSWCNLFSWSESDDFLVKTRRELENQIDSPPDYDRIVEFLKKEIPTGWRRKNFEDFEYLEVEYPDWIYTLVISVSLISSITISVICIKNDS